MNTSMNACLHCGADLQTDVCGFCCTVAPRSMAGLLRPEARGFLRRHATRELLAFSERSKFRGLARSLCDMRALKLLSYRGRTARYGWTDYGRALAAQA